MFKKYSLLVLALAFVALPQLSFAKEKEAEMRIDSRAKVEKVHDDRGFFKNFWLPFGILKKIAHHSSATSTPDSREPIEVRASFLSSLRTFFSNLTASTTYQFTLTATDPSGHATSTNLGFFTTK